LIERIPGPFASLYEKATRLAVETYYREVAEEVVSFLDSGRILDLGTGPGLLPMEIAKRAPSLLIDAIDLSPKLIKMAREKASRAGSEDRLRFGVGNAAHVRAEDETYDMVLSTGMLHMLRDPVRVLKECYRVLKPGREAWIYDPARISSQVNVEKWRESLSILERAARLLFKLFVLLHPSRSYDRKEIADLIAETPFKTYWISEERGEIKLRLKKQADPGETTTVSSGQDPGGVALPVQ